MKISKNALEVLTSVAASNDWSQYQGSNLTQLLKQPLTPNIFDEIVVGTVDCRVRSTLHAVWLWDTKHGWGATLDMMTGDEISAFTEFLMSKYANDETLNRILAFLRQIEPECRVIKTRYQEVLQHVNMSGCSSIFTHRNDIRVEVEHIENPTRMVKSIVNAACRAGELCEATHRCHVCLCNINQNDHAQLPCGHSTHSSCLEQALLHLKKECGICRRTIPQPKWNPWTKAT